MSSSGGQRADKAVLGGYPTNREDAQARWNLCSDDDPFPSVPATILSSEHVKAYAKNATLMHPFYEDKVKAATYEVRPGGQFIRWDPVSNKKVVEDIETLKKSGKTSITIPKNSIAFVQLESEFYLPSYIAARFNLRITHVHRGLLLGTGPVVDPGFRGHILIPIHNLTSDDYDIDLTDGIIWVDFTKTSRAVNLSNSGLEKDAFQPMPPYKIDRAPEYYLEKANQNNPIQSSIPQSIKDMEGRSRTLEASARRMKRNSYFLTTVGVIAIAGIFVSLYSFMETARATTIGLVERTAQAYERALQANEEIKSLKAEVQRLTDEVQILTKRSRTMDGAAQDGRREPTPARSSTP